MTMRRPERQAKPTGQGPETVFADEIQEQNGAETADVVSERERNFREMIARIKQAEAEAAQELHEAEKVEQEWDRVMKPLQPESGVVYAKPVRKAVSGWKTRLLKAVGKLAFGVSLFASAQVHAVSASEGQFSKGMEQESEAKALVEELEDVARSLIDIEEQYAPSIVGMTRRWVRGVKADYPEVEPRAMAVDQRAELPEAGAEHYEQFSQEASTRLRHVIDGGTVPVGEDYAVWMEDVLDPLVKEYAARHGVTINLREGPVETGVQQMLRNYIDETADADPERASRVADALEYGDGFRLAVQRHDGRVASRRLVEYLSHNHQAACDVVTEGPEHLHWVLPQMTPVERVDLLNVLQDAESVARSLERANGNPAHGREASRLRAAIQVVESVRR